jgi:hypothetical protein
MFTHIEGIQFFKIQIETKENIIQHQMQQTTMERVTHFNFLFSVLLDYIAKKAKALPARTVNPTPV